MVTPDAARGSDKSDAPALVWGSGIGYIFTGRHIVGRCLQRMLRTISICCLFKNNNSDFVQWMLNVHSRALLAGSADKAMDTRALADLEHRSKPCPRGVRFF